MGGTAAAVASWIGEAVGGAGAAGGAATAAEGAIGTGVGLGSVGTAAVQGVAGAVAGAGLSKLLAPKLPGVKQPTPMPDQSAIEAAKRRSVVQQRQRAGRDSTILTQGDGGTLG